MINLRNSPFLWLAFLLIISFTLGDNLRIFSYTWATALFAFMMLASLYGAILKYDPSLKYLSTISISCMVFLSGLWRQYQFHQELYPASILTKPILMEGTVSIEEVLKSKETSLSIQGQILHLTSQKDSSRVEYRDRYILLQIRNPVKKDLFPGDQLDFSGWVSPIQAPLNPYAFDARVYYNTIGIRHQVTCKGEEIVVRTSKKFSLNRLTARWQAALSNKVRLHTSAQVAQVTNALVWGDRSDMDSDVRDAFADSGAMHVLSVSGMHVAMIYSILFLFFGAPGDGIFIKRIIRFIFYASAILLYVGLTGACPAVVRAGLMILLFLFGKTMGWNTQIWNLLGFAAFMMLWLNPYVYHNIGFQLSFLAIAGILLFAKPIIRSLSFQSKILHWTWEIVSLSLAAQVFIVPILLRQFHQFPLTFIISSIVAIPAGYIIIVGALINVFLSFVGFDFLWPPLEWTGYYFIRSMKWMAALNPAMNYSMTPTAGWLIFLMSVIFSAAVVYHWPKGKYLAYGLGVTALTLLAIHRTSVWSGKELLIYHTFKGVLIDATANGFCHSLKEGDLSPEQIEFAARGNRCERDNIAVKTLGFHDTIQTADFIYENNRLNFSTYSILIVNTYSIEKEEVKKYTHLLITNTDSIPAVKNIICNHPDAVVILPASLARKTKNNLVYFLKGNDIKYYDIAQSGYLRFIP
jgi:ComEC/Rec2-related protein